MKHFEYTIRDAAGLRGKSAGQIVRIAKQYADTSILVQGCGRIASATQRLKLMGLGARAGNLVTVTVEGPSEVEASIALRNFFQNNL